MDDVYVCVCIYILHKPHGFPQPPNGPCFYSTNGQPFLGPGT